MVVPFILVLELVSKRKRGVFMGLINAGFTTGVSLGAVVYGALINKPGWVSFIRRDAGLAISWHILDMFVRYQPLTNVAPHR